ncbi:MAG TPA: ATP-binding protein [Acidimicrobiales bacterium]|nr:ATP-binding protein [Acidimicrobiales bacterium]
MEARTQLRPDPTSVRAARQFIATALAEWHHEELLDAAVLLTSELVTNAVLYARTAISIVVDLTGDRLRVEVIDSNPLPPIPRVAGEDATSGRGLALVEALARAWGIDTIPPSGKRVWFEVAA